MSIPNGRRLLALRELHSITQTQMASTLGISQPSLSQIEKAERPLPAELMAHAADTYRVPPSFFLVPPTVLEISVATFRKSSAAKVSDERRIVRLYREAARAFSAVSQASGYHEFHAPAEVTDSTAIDDAASALRRLGGVASDAPILNMVRFLERLGIGVVTALDAPSTGDAPTHSGISIPHPDVTRPLIALPTTGRGDAARFTLAHELAHLLWDQGTTGPSTSTRSPQEKRAHAFAGALLLPTEVLHQRVTDTLNLHGYLPIKAEYGISVGAIIMAAKRANIISADRARSLHIQLSSRGWRNNEPVHVAEERPLLFGQALARATTNPSRSAEDLTGLPTSLLERWTDTELLAPPVQLSAWRNRRTT